jgi:ComF family protein
LDLFLLFFPSTCIICGNRLPDHRIVLCFPCEIRMPRSGLGDPQLNPVSRIFWGRVPVKAGTSLFHLEKGSAYRVLLHDLKYRDNRRAGFYLGRLLGLAVKQAFLSDCDLLIPVPLHRKKLNQRGYNQSELIARGVSEVTGIPLGSHLIRRTRHQRSQTQMSRQERFENMASAFALCEDPPDLNGRKILIIDDVVTTGATLEACSQVLIDRFHCQVCVATVSYA